MTRKASRGNGNFGRPAADELAEGATRRFPHLLLVMGVEPHPIPIEHPGQQHLGIEPGALRPSTLEEVGGPDQEAADGPPPVRFGGTGGAGGGA